MFTFDSLHSFTHEKRSLSENKEGTGKEKVCLRNKIEQILKGNYLNRTNKCEKNTHNRKRGWGAMFIDSTTQAIRKVKLHLGSYFNFKNSRSSSCIIDTATSLNDRLFQNHHILTRVSSIIKN